MLQMRRSRGAFSGFLLMLLGLWGALIPFVGPYFDYAYTPDKAWTYNTGRLWLEVLPGAAVFLGGFLLMVARSRHTALFGALLAAVAGAWFTLGPVLSPLWNHHVPMGGSPASSTVYMRIMEQLGFFTALGVVIVFIAAVALGRIASVPSGIREIEEVPETTVPADTVPVETIRDERVRDDTVRDDTVRDETVTDETDRGETVSSEETRPVHARLLPRRKTEDTTQTVG
jgi:hypothetical protein